MKSTLLIFILLIIQLLFKSSFTNGFEYDYSTKNDLIPNFVASTTETECLASSIFSSNVPIFVIMTADGTNLVRQINENAYLKVFWKPNGDRNYLTDTPFLSIKIKASFKGHSSSEFPKKQIGIKTLDDTCDSKVDVAFPGMNNGTGFRFTASYPDKSLMRNKLVYTLARNIAGSSDWGAPDTQFCEVFLVTDIASGIFPTASSLKSTYYYGAFLLGETVERDKNRVNIEKVWIFFILEY